MRGELWDPKRAALADAYSLAALGPLAPVLMERAALALANWVDELLGDPKASVLILAGPGNNGGDGVALARILHLRGRPVVVHLVCGRRGESVCQQSAAAEALGVRVVEGLPGAETEAALYVDALLGTGAQGEPRGAVAEALGWLEGRGCVLSVDLPSGVDGQTGTAARSHVSAESTLTFERSMPGLHMGPGRRACGRLRVAMIGLVVDPTVDEAAPVLIDPAWVAERLGAQAPAAHKGQRGHVLVLGGSEGTEGACLLSGAAALGGGAGLVTLCSDSKVLAGLSLEQRPELMRIPWRASEWSARGEVLVVGPGLTAKSALSQVAPLWRDDARPSVWDASALGLELRAGHGRARVVTPHPKEAAGLLTSLHGEAWDVGRVQSDRIAAARQLSGLTGATVVLKGVGTVVCAGDRVAVNTTGDERLATAGSGDVLAGLIAALLARGEAPFEAACLGVHLHGLAGEAQPSTGARALELCDALPKVLAGPYEGKEWPEFVRG